VKVIHTNEVSCFAVFQSKQRECTHELTLLYDSVLPGYCAPILRMNASTRTFDGAFSVVNLLCNMFNILCVFEVLSCLFCTGMNRHIRLKSRQIAAENLPAFLGLINDRQCFEVQPPPKDFKK